MKAVYFVATALASVVMFWVGFQLRPVLDPWEQQEVAAVPEDGSVEVRQTEQSVEDLAAQGYLSAEELKVRIDDGEVQWFDGTMWHTVASMEEMAKEDKFYEAQEGFLEFVEQLKQQWEDRRAEQENPQERGETLLVGQKETPKPVEKPRQTKPAETAPAEETVSAPVAPSEGGSNPGGNDGGSNPSGGDSGNSGGGNNPGGGDSGNSGGGNPSGDNGGGSNPSGDNGGGGNPGGDNGGGNNPGGDDGNTDDGGSAGDSSNAGSDDSGGNTGDGENMEWSDDYL